MKVVLYLRYSSDKQREASIEGQEMVCRRFCEIKEYEIVGKYIDREKSAYKDVTKRLNFLKMLDDSSLGTFQGVVVYAYDRFSRNQLEAQQYEKILNDNGVRLISCNEPGSGDSPQDKFIKSFFQSYAEFYSAELSQKVKRGIKVSHSKRTHVGGVLPFGYSDKFYTINESEAEIVRLIFDTYKNGKSMIDIANMLNEKGLTTRKGNKWGRSSFHAILSNTNYIGTYHYNDTNEKGEKVLVEIENVITPIVDEKTFYEVQEQLKIREYRKVRESKHLYLMANQIYHICNDGCETKLYGESAKGKGGFYYYYTCPICKKRYRCSEIDDDIYNTTLKYLNKDMREKIIDLLFDILKNDYAKNDRLPKLQEKKKELERIIQVHYKMAEQQGGWDEYLTKRHNEVLDELKQTRIEIIREEKTPLTPDRAEVEAYINGICDMEHSTLEQKNILLAHVVDKAVINQENEMDVYFFVIPEKMSSNNVRIRTLTTFSRTINMYIVY